MMFFWVLVPCKLVDVNVLEEHTVPIFDREKNSGQTNGEINIKVQNNPKFYQIISGIIWNR